MKLDSKIMEKAATLIEALPYIQRFNRKDYCRKVWRKCNGR